MPSTLHHIMFIIQQFSEYPLVAFFIWGMEFVITLRTYSLSVVELDFKLNYNILASFIWNIPNILLLEIIYDFVTCGMNNFNINLQTISHRLCMAI